MGGGGGGGERGRGRGRDIKEIDYCHSLASRDWCNLFITNIPMNVLIAHVELTISLQ